MYTRHGVNYSLQTFLWEDCARGNSQIVAAVYDRRPLGDRESYGGETRPPLQLQKDVLLGWRDRWSFGGGGLIQATPLQKRRDIGIAAGEVAEQLHGIVAA